MGCIISLNDNNDTKCKNKVMIMLSNEKVDKKEKEKSGKKNYLKCKKVYETTDSNSCNTWKMLKSPDQYARVDMYAKKQHLVMTFVVKRNH